MKIALLKKTRKLVKALAFILPLILFETAANAQEVNGNTTIHLAGRVLDASTFKPLSNATIKFKTQEFTTSENGSFLYSIEVPSTNASFMFRVKKDGYNGLNDTENWGNSNGHVKKAILYIGIDKTDKSKQFVLSIPYDGDNRYAENGYVDSVFEKLRVDKHLKELAVLRDSIKAYPDRIYFAIGNLHFITSNRSYLIIGSEEDMVSINGEKIKPKDINNRFKRRKIRGMTTIEPN